MSLALVGRFLVAVEDDHRNACLGGDIGDASAHEAAADDADLLELGLRYAFRTAGALVELLQRHEQRADHRRRFPGLEYLGEVALLDAQCSVERHQQALVDAFQDRRGGRVVAVGLAAEDGDRRRPQIGARGRIDRTARRLEALLVPRRDRLEAVADHRLGGVDQPGRLYDLVDETHLLGLRRRQVLAGGQHLQRALRVGQPGHALRAASAREDADLDLRQGHLDLVGIRRDAAVAGQRHFEGAAHAGAVDRRDPRLARCLDLAEQPVHRADAIEQRLRRLLGVLRLVGSELLQRTLHHGEVRTAGIGFLARRDDRALDGFVLGHLVDDPVELGDRLLGEHVHRAARHVPSHQGDAVGVDVEAEILVGHCAVLSIRRVR